MGASALSLLLALAPVVLLEESCNDWSPLSQVALNFETLGYISTPGFKTFFVSSLCLGKACGATHTLCHTAHSKGWIAFDLTISSLYILVIFQKKHGLNVMVDKASHDSVTEFFALPSQSLLPVVEEHFCPSALQNLKQHMKDFTKNSPDHLESSLISLAQGQVVNLWPEGPLETANYWVPDNLIREFGPWIKQLFQFK